MTVADVVTIDFVAVVVVDENAVVRQDRVDGLVDVAEVIVGEVVNVATAAEEED